MSVEMIALMSHAMQLNCTTANLNDYSLCIELM